MPEVPLLETDFFFILSYIIRREYFWQQMPEIPLTSLICNIWYRNETKDVNSFSAGSPQ